MWKVYLLSCLVCLAALSAGCGGKPTVQSLNKDFIQILNEFTDILATVKDQATADTAKEKIHGLVGRASKVMEQMRELESSSKMSPEEKESSSKELLKGMEASNQKMMQIMTSKQDPAQMKLLAPLLREFASYLTMSKPK